MKRWFVVLLVLLAVLVLVTPGIVGRLTEKSLGENLAWPASENSGIEIRMERFDRGWFTSEGRHRVTLSSGTLREAGENFRQANGYEELPSLVVDTRLDHGLLPVGSLTRDSGSLAPGLASTLSTFQIDPGNGELVALPGTLYSNVGLSGASDLRFLLETGRFEHAAGSVDWAGADITLQTDPSDGKLVIDGTIEPFTIASDDKLIRVGAVTVATDQARSAFGFNEGSVRIDLDSFVVESPGDALTVGAIAFSADADVTGARLDVRSKLSVDGIVVPAMGEMSFVLDLALNRLDAESMQVIARALEKTRESADPDATLTGLFPQIEDELQKLVSSGAEIRIDEFALTLPQGTLTTNLLVEIPERDAGADFSWSSVLLATTASADIRVPVELFEFIKTMNPQANALVAMGILQRDGEHYVMNARYAQGLLNVNGAPMPIPLPTM